MNQQNESGNTIARLDVSDAPDIGRRNLLKMTGVCITSLTVGKVAAEQAAAQPPIQGADKWDKTFAKSNKVDHRKVSFKNRYGITFAADLYQPRNVSGRLAALTIGGRFGAVKERRPGLWTSHERGEGRRSAIPGGLPRLLQNAARFPPLQRHNESSASLIP